MNLHNDRIRMLAARWKAPFRRLADERGMTLIEILVAVSIMAIISVSIMGVFTAATERSAEQNRRLIAASLARQQLVEWRQMSRSADMAPPATNYRNLLATFGAGAPLAFSAESPLPPPYDGLLDPVVINGTTYRFLATVDKVFPADWSGRMASLGGSDLLLRLKITVFWDGGPVPRSAADSVTLEGYVTDG